MRTLVNWNHFLIQHIHSNPLKYKNLSYPFFTMKCSICYSNAHPPHIWNDIYHGWRIPIINRLLNTLFWLGRQPKVISCRCIFYIKPRLWLDTDTVVEWISGCLVRLTRGSSVMMHNTCSDTHFIKIGSFLANIKFIPKMHWSSYLTEYGPQEHNRQKHSLLSRGNNNIPV